MKENIFSVKSLVTVSERACAKPREKANVIWITGFSGSGKSTLSFLLEKKLIEMNVLAIALDGDNVRSGLCSNLRFSAEDRSENLRRVMHVASLFQKAGVTVLVSFISPYKKDRNLARSLIGEGFVEVFVNCPLSVCEERDVKGLYAKARAGEISDFTGISAPYEKPESPDVVICSNIESKEESVDKVLSHIDFI